MPETDGIALLRQLKAEGKECPVIVITGHADIHLAIEAMTLGAFDFIEKPFDAHVLLAAVRAVTDSQRASMLEQTKKGVVDRLATLSDRERYVFDRIVLGRPNRAVAEELGYTERIVEIYSANIMAQMDAASLSGLIRMVLSLK